MPRKIPTARRSEIEREKKPTHHRNRHHSCCPYWIKSCRFFTVHSIQHMHCPLKRQSNIHMVFSLSLFLRFLFSKWTPSTSHTNTTAHTLTFAWNANTNTFVTTHGVRNKREKNGWIFFPSKAQTSNSETVRACIWEIGYMCMSGGVFNCFSFQIVSMMMKSLFTRSLRVSIAIEMLEHRTAK